MSTNATQNQSTNAYTVAGNKERANLLWFYNQIGVTNYTFTDATGYDRVEGFFTTPAGVKYVVEAKCRNDRSTSYPTHMIEKKKYDVLSDYQSKGYVPLYINFFTDGKTIVYNLSKRITNSTIGWNVQNCRSTSAVKGNYVEKAVGFLSVDKTFGDKTL